MVEAIGHLTNLTVVNFPQEKNSVGMLEESFPDRVNLHQRQVNLSSTNGGL